MAPRVFVFVENVFPGTPVNGELFWMMSYIIDVGVHKLNFKSGVFHATIPNKPDLLPGTLVTALDMLEAYPDLTEQEEVIIDRCNEYYRKVQKKGSGSDHNKFTCKDMEAGIEAVKELTEMFENDARCRGVVDFELSKHVPMTGEGSFLILVMLFLGLPSC